MADKKEGWGQVPGSPKWHYFRNCDSLCRRYGFRMRDDDLQQGNDDSLDNCKACVKALKKKQQLSSKIPKNIQEELDKLKTFNQAVKRNFGGK